MTRFALQFGQTQAGLIYRERMSVYGLCPRGEHLAITRIGKAAPFDYDLPGGGIEADEDEAAALMREFQEEAGLTVWPIRIIGRAGQYWLPQGEARNSLAAFYEVELTSIDGDPSEADHKRFWMTPADAMPLLRHEAHAWAVMHWMRGRRKV